MSRLQHMEHDQWVGIQVCGAESASALWSSPLTTAPSLLSLCV